MKYTELAIGDIIARINNINERYVITGFGSCNNKITWQGIDPRGRDQGGTIVGSWDFDSFALVGHMDLDFLDQIKRPECNTTITAENKSVEIHNCPDEVDRWVVARNQNDKWYYWADFKDQKNAIQSANDLKSWYELNKEIKPVEVFSADYKWQRVDVSSHSEKDILDGCIALMRELNDRFLEYLDFMDVEVGDDEYKWCTFFSYFEIVQRLFLYHTKHSGGTSTRMKIAELGFDDPSDVVFEDTRMEEEE